MLRSPIDSRRARDQSRDRRAGAGEMCPTAATENMPPPSADINYDDEDDLVRDGELLSVCVRPPHPRPCAASSHDFELLNCSLPLADDCCLPILPSLYGPAMVRYKDVSGGAVFLLAEVAC